MLWKHCLEKSVIKTVRFYQLAISPHLPSACRFEPTCSQYCILVIKEYGLAKGIFLTAKRVLRCNPFIKNY